MNDAVDSGLGELEQIVLLAVLRLEENAYGITIIQELERVMRRGVSRPSVYLALARLHKKGLLSSKVGDPTPQRGGRAKRFYRVTPPGLEAVRSARSAYLKLWRGLEPILDRR